MAASQSSAVVAVTGGTLAYTYLSCIHIHILYNVNTFIGILASVFVAALLALLFICRNRLCSGFTLNKKKENLEIQQDGFHVR